MGTGNVEILVSPGRASILTFGLASILTAGACFFSFGFRILKIKSNYEKPSERRAREMAESTRRVRKLMRKRLEREGY